MRKVLFAVCAAFSALSVVRGEGESCETSDWHIPDDELALCNVGSACREEFRQANGSTDDLWPDQDRKIRDSRVQSEKNRLRLNEYQPGIVPKYTELGYKKEKLNADTYAYLMEWYDSPIRRSVTENWPPDNTYVNHWKHDTTMVTAPKRIHQRLYDDLLPLMEDWAGAKLKPTSCYGVRLYYRGSVLANHVDRIDTHVISAIINVAQDNVDTDWPLYVRGHDGVARDIFIEPGEIIFYESASVIHGRPEAFQGDSFANIFVHFAPVEGWTVTANDVQKAARDGDRVKRAAERRTQGREQ